MERFKQKVASSSSRVIASLQQAATGTFQQQQQPPQPAQQAKQAEQQPQQPQFATVYQATRPTTSLEPEPSVVQQQQQQQQAPMAGQPPTTAWLMAADATAHLTEKEREILLEVFKKEEQFQRDTIKQMTASRAIQQQQQQQQETQPQRACGQSAVGQPAGKENGNNNQSIHHHHHPNQQQQQQQQSQSSNSNNSFATATPTSRPGSSLFGTPIGQQQRVPSACSTSTTNTTTAGDPLGQCRICRKSITAAEPCHLCSNCNQFICEDCASYSASEQHWMCSSCRRRTMNPAIPADALKELGLNQNSSAVRRMTLRLNQNELNLTTQKSSSESTASSNSSSGCSSMSNKSTSTLVGTTTSSTTPTGQQQRRPSARLVGAVPSSQRRMTMDRELQQQAIRRQSVATYAQRAGDSPTGRQQSGDLGALGQQQVRATPLSVLRSDLKRRPSAQVEMLQRDAADSRSFQKTMSQPTKAEQRQQAHVSPMQPAGGDTQRFRMAPANQQGGLQQAMDNRQSTQQQQHQSRRASVAVAGAGNLPGQRQPNSWRKQSIAFIHQNSLAFHQQHQRNSMVQHLQQFAIQPQTMVTASSEMSVDGQHDSGASSVREPSSRRQSRRDSQLIYQHPNGAQTTLIPVPPDQIHLRRLSDQSNLVRRSSIIADTIDSITLARNRSHSNIDTVTCANYFVQQQQQQQQHERLQQQSGYSDENISQLNPMAFAGEQRRLSDQWDIQQRQQQQQQLINAEQVVGYQQQSRQQAGAANQQRYSQMSSIITSYAQKQRDSTEDLRSDSSSDIDDTNESRAFQTGMDFEDEQARALGYQQGAESASQMAIPSVSVSEFSNNPSHFQHHGQPRYQQQQQQHQNPQLEQQQAFDPILTSPMHINVAIEQAIQQQQQQQSAYELSPGPQQQGAGYLIPRRGSSGRVLPKIPGEQSRSLLDLPHQNASQSNLAPDAQHSTLDLPCVSPTIRRASAPEGQNIKIVVDDIDSSMLAHAGGCAAGHTKYGMYGKQGELFERLVLYRDDSLESNAGRGFGLHVTGGKIHEDGHLHAHITWVLTGGPADKVGLRPGDQVIEWDGKCLLDMTYEQVAEVIEDSANIAELLVRPARKLEPLPGANLVRSQRRLSQQTERDLKKFQQQQQHHAQLDGLGLGQQLDSQLAKNQRRLSGQFQIAQVRQFAATNYATGRTGTGRRLPQIPGMMAANEAGLMGAPVISKTGSSSTGQLETIELSNGFGASALSGMSHHLNAAVHEQQSRSANELYNGELSYVNQHNIAPVRNGVSSETLTSNQQQQQQQQQHYWPQQRPLGNSSAAGLYGQQRNHSGNHLGVAGTASSGRDEICGLIGLQVSVDERVSQLEISVLSVVNIDRDLASDYYVRVKILPESNNFKPCTTQPSSDLNWKETFIFQNFPIQQVHRMALEIGVWVYDEAPRLSTQMAQPICEALIPIQSARERNTDFWPLRAPPTSPQARRKSLNDLLESHADNRAGHEPSRLSQGHPSSATHTGRGYYEPQQQQQSLGYLPRSALQGSSHGGSVSGQVFVRERSSSNRNLPDTNKLQAQPRRASDEVATSSSYKIMSRLSPAASRRSISVMNVQGDAASLFNKQPGSGSRLGSQANILARTQARRDSNQNSPVNQQHSSPSAIRAGSDSQAPTAVGVTSTGRRSSLVGIQSMAGYRSQKNSLSDDKESSTSPHRSSLTGRRPGTATPSQKSQALGDSKRAQASQQQESSYQNTSGSSSRRNSNERTPQLQRRGSFAKQTLQRFKRTMSLTKGSDQQQEAASGSGGGSRRSSSSSGGERADNRGEQEMGATRSVAHNMAVGKIKLSFVMTKGQFEIEVICVHGLRFDPEVTVGVYVKIYLKGKSKSNKRKTRIVQPVDSPIFRHMIKYDASLMDNKTLEVSVWLKQRGRKGKVSIGYTEIRPSELDLAQLTTSWYNLRPMDAQSSSSIEEFS